MLHIHAPIGALINSKAGQIITLSVLCDLDNSLFVSLSRESVFVLIMYCTLSIMLGFLTSSVSCSIRLLKRGGSSVS